MREKSNWTLGENKPKQSQFVFLTAENAEYAEKKGMRVSYCPIDKYAFCPISPCSLRTQWLKKNKANFRPLAGSDGPAVKWAIASKVGLENKPTLCYDSK